MNDKNVMVVKDDESIKNIFIQLNEKENSTSVLSNFSPWENLAYIMEALAVTIQQCILEGIEREKVYGTVKTYLKDILGNYRM